MLHDHIKAAVTARETYRAPLVLAGEPGGPLPRIVVYVRESFGLTAEAAAGARERAAAAVSRALLGCYEVEVRRVCRRCWLPTCEGPGAHPTGHPHDELDYTQRLIEQLSDVALEQLLRVWGGASGTFRTAELVRAAKARGLGG